MVGADVFRQEPASDGMVKHPTYGYAVQACTLDAKTDDAVSRALSVLARRGFLQKQRNRQDKRALEVSLTPSGWRYYGAVMPLMKSRSDITGACSRERSWTHYTRHSTASTRNVDCMEKTWSFGTLLRRSYAITVWFSPPSYAATKRGETRRKRSKSTRPERVM